MLAAPERVLPRPMSLCAAPPGELWFLIDPIGPGTRALCALEPGETAARVSARSATASASTSSGRCSSAAGSGSRRCRTSPRRWAQPPAVLGFRSDRHAEAAALVPNARGGRRADARDRGDRPTGFDVLACGPEPMLDAVAALAPGAQLAWEAPMACGYGACYGCVVEVDGELKRLCVEGPVLVCCLTRRAAWTRWPRPRWRARSTRS